MTKKFISAGAGSGKTYTITTDVAKMVKDHLLNPDQVIMTTFTKAAAQELREKAKKELAKLGLHREAQQMEHALIGTVHSVANTFLTKYWYLLGIMPDAAAMEESELQMYRDHSLRGLLNMTIVHSCIVLQRPTTSSIKTTVSLVPITSSGRKTSVRFSTTSSGIVSATSS
jgi:superfamily I DNA/RNA helicase